MQKRVSFFKNKKQFQISSEKMDVGIGNKKKFNNFCVCVFFSRMIFCTKKENKKDSLICCFLQERISNVSLVIVLCKSKRLIV